MRFAGQRPAGAVVESVQVTADGATERVPGGPRGYCDYYKQALGPGAAIYAALTPGQAAALDRDFLSFATRSNTGPANGPAELNY